MTCPRAAIALSVLCAAWSPHLTAAVKVDVLVSPAPNVFGSPSYAGWFLNAQRFALGLEAAPAGSGNEAFRGDYAGGTRPCPEFLVTSFDAFDGLVGGTGEFGQRMHAVYHIYDDAGGFVELSKVRGLGVDAEYDFAQDPGATFGPFDFNDSTEFDPPRRVGFNDEDLTTPITSGSDPVNHIVGTFGQAYWPGSDAPDPSTDPSGPAGYLSCFADYPNDVGSGHIRFTFAAAYETDTDLVSGSATVQNSSTTFGLRVEDVFAPLDPVKVFAGATTGKTLVTGVAGTLTFDDARYTFGGVEVASSSGLAGVWSVLTATSPGPGRADFAAGDPSPTPPGLDGPLSGLETVCITLVPRSSACDSAASTFDLDGASLSFVEVGAGVVRGDASWRNDSAAGPVVVADHGFRRGNVNNLGVPFELNLSDVVDLANMLFGGLPLIDCLGAVDVNNDGRFNITDFVTLVQGVFNSGQVTIPRPSSPRGLSVEPDGGRIPSELGCNTGQGCP